MKKSKLQLFILFLVAALSACSMPARNGIPTQAIDQGLVGTIAAMTLQAYSTPAPITTAIMTATQILTPTATATITITPTFTVPMVLFEGNTNCRKGPGAGYDVITVVLNGQKAEAIGVSEKGNYWLIKNPNKGDPCWVANDMTKPSGSILQLPTVMAPATPTPNPPNAPAWAAYNYTCEFASGGNNLTMNLTWADRSSNEEGYIVYRDKQAIVTLAANTTNYVDVVFVPTGQTVSYSVEGFNNAARATSSTITAGCQ